MNSYFSRFISVLSLALIVSTGSFAQSRLVANASSIKDGTDMRVNDSATYSYSGSRGAYFNGVTQGWKYDSSLYFVYSSVDLMLNKSMKYIQTFDAAGNIATLTVFRWKAVTSGWETARYEMFTYDGRNQLLTSKVQTWVPAISALRDYQNTTYTYTAGNKVAQSIFQTWNPTAGTWDNSMKTTYTYDGSDRETLQLIESWDGTAGTWKNNKKIASSYDVSGNLISQVTELWTSAWENYMKEVFTYDASNNCLNVLYSSWTGTSFHTDYRETNSGFTSRKPGTTIAEMESTPGVFVNAKKKNYTYNTFLQTVSQAELNWNVSAWESNTDRRYYYESVTADVPGITQGVSAVTVYPVPAKSELFADVTWRQPQAFDIVIIDMQGRVVSTQHIAACRSCHSTITTADLPAGNYTVNLAGNRESVSRMVTIEK